MSQPVNRSVNIYFNTDSAERALDNLNARSKKLKQSIADGEKAGKDMSKAIAELGATQSKIDSLDKIMSGKMAPTLQMVQRRAQELRRELERMSKDAPEYASKFSEFQQVSSRLQLMQADVRAVSGAMRDASQASSNWWRDVKAIATGAIIGDFAQSLLSQIVNGFRNAVKSAADLSDSLADVRKAAGLTQEEAVLLNRALSDIQTRTPTKELREIAVGLGQIGQAATPEAVAAIDKIVVALGDEFGGGAREITTVLGILRNNLQDLKSANYGADVLAIGNALNKLGAEGLATAPVVVDFANRLAGVAGTFKISSGEILGISAAMQELGIEVERGATAMNKIFQKIAAEPAKFAKVAGTGVQEFVKLVNTDMVAAFNAVAVGAGKASDKNTVFAAILKDLDADGAGAGEVLSKLSKNQELLAGKIKLASDALKSSSSITEEFNIKNNNLAGTVEKIGKVFSRVYAKSGIPSFITSTVSAFAELIGAVDNSQRSLDNFREQQQKVQRLQSEMLPLIQRYEELRTKTTLSKDEQVEMNKAITSIANNIPTAITQFDKYGNAIAISTQKARDFIENQVLMKKEMNRQAIKDTESTIGNLKKELATYQTQLGSTQRGYARDMASLDAFKKDDPYRVEKENFYNKFYGEGIAKISEKIRELNDRIRGNVAIVEELNGTALKKQIADTKATSTTTPASTGGGGTGYTPAEDDKKAADLLRRQKEFLEKLRAMRGEAEAAAQSDDQKEIERVKNKYEALMREAAELLGNTRKMIEASSLISEAQKAELEALYAKQFSERSEKEYAETLAKTKSHFDKERKIADDAFIAGEISAQEHSNKIEQIAIDEADAKAVVARDYVDTVKKASDDLTAYEEQNSARRVQAEGQARERAGAEYLAEAEFKVATSRSGSLAELDARKVLLQRRFELESANMDKTSNMYQSRQAKLNREMGQLDAQYVASKIQQYAQMAQIGLDFYNTITQAAIASLQAEVNKMKEQGDAEKASLQKRLNQNKISKQRYNKEVEKIDKAQAQKEKELKVKQFEADRNAKLVQGGINLAMAISNIVATQAGNPILMGILIGAATILNGAQMAFIASQKAPEFAYGRKPLGEGGVPEGPSHANGGIALIDPYGRKVGEMEGNEPILSVATYRNNKAIVDRLLDASMYGGGRSIDTSWATNSTNVDIGAVTSSISQARFAYGRPMTSGSDFTSAQSGVLSENDTRILREFITGISQGVRAYTYYNESDRLNNEIATLKKQSSQRPR